MKIHEINVEPYQESAWQDLYGGSLNQISRGYRLPKMRRDEQSLGEEDRRRRGDIDRLFQPVRVAIRL
jgi:hypothetical protein